MIVPDRSIRGVVRAPRQPRVSANPFYPLYQGANGVIESKGLIGDSKAQNPNGGASIIVLAGVGTNGPNWTGFANLYLNPSNLADPNGLLTGQPGKVVETYQDQLYSWLRQFYTYTRRKPDSLAYFRSLPIEEQSVFLSGVYFSELNQAGLSYNDSNSRFFHSYIRGNEAIASLFPSVGSNGQKINYRGGLTLLITVEVVGFGPPK